MKLIKKHPVRKCGKRVLKNQKKKRKLIILQNLKDQKQIRRKQHGRKCNRKTKFKFFHDSLMVYNIHLPDRLCRYHKKNY